MKKYLNSVVNIPKNLALLLLEAYQFLFSPDHSWLKEKFPHGYCRFYPSCSQYCKDAIIRFGLVKGGLLGVKRIVKCHPWAETKVDPVPNL